MYAIVKDGVVVDIVSLPEDAKLADLDFLSEEQKNAAVEIPEDELSVRRYWKYDGLYYSALFLRMCTHSQDLVFITADSPGA
jgi:hypothetical protein